MAADVDDKFMKAGASTVTELAAPGKALAATGITVGSTDGYPTDTGFVLGIRQISADTGALVPDSYSEYYATVASATEFTIDPTPAYGDDQVYPAGTTTQVFLPLSSAAHNRMVDGMLVEHDQDGAHTDVTADTVTTGTLTVSTSAVIGGTEGRLKTVTPYTSSDTWSKSANLKFVIVEVQGAGAGGGGTASTSASQRAGAGGGGGGGYCMKKIAAASLGSSETVTIGAAGIAGSSGGGNGGTGGTSSFGSHCSAVGGGGGDGATASGSGDASSADGGGGGAASGGDINVPGARGFQGYIFDARSVSLGHGANSRFGSGGGGSGGSAATGYGAGGAGRNVGVSSSAQAGHAGSQGIVIVYEYF